MSLRTFCPWLPRNRILCLTMFFINKKYSVAMGSPLGPTMAKVFLLFYEMA